MTEDEFNTAKDLVRYSVQHPDGAIYQLSSQIFMTSGIIGDWNKLQGFWKSENVGEKLMLMVTELAEGMEADRKDLMCDKPGLEHLTGMEEELADCMIRIFDFAGHFKINLAQALKDKLIFNLSRPYMHGKKN